MAKGSTFYLGASSNNYLISNAYEESAVALTYKILASVGLASAKRQSPISVEFPKFL